MAENDLALALATIARLEQEVETLTAQKAECQTLLHDAKVERDLRNMENRRLAALCDRVKAEAEAVLDPARGDSETEAALHALREIGVEANEPGRRELG
jgi:hypothetical protein